MLEGLINDSIWKTERNDTDKNKTGKSHTDP